MYNSKFIIKLLKQNWPILIVVVIGVFFRAYKPLTFFQYGHDQDLAGWFLRDVLINHHIRLIGQETSSHGIFIGPYFYYLLIPFYLLTGLDPAGSLVLSIVLGCFSIASIYFVFWKIFNKEIGIIGAIVFAISTLIVFTEREVDPTMPVFLWTIWYLFALTRILTKQKYGYVILGILIGLIWSINLQFIILLPLAILAQVFSKKKINPKELVSGGVIAVVLNVPFILFELRHGFQQTKALILSLTTSKDYIAGTSPSFLAKLDRVMQLVYKNSTNVFAGYVFDFPNKIIFWVLNLLLIYFAYKKKIKRELGVILILWEIIYILFFAKISLNVSEYYLNGMIVIFLLIFALCENVLIQNKNKLLKFVGFFIFVAFIFLNSLSFFTKPVNADGYIERKAIITAIKEDAAKHNYPCVSLSFITSPGNDLGYRYFTWESDLKTKPISNNVPVYSIVFPLSKVDGFDKSFGALGLVNPDYKRYNLKTVRESCEGEDYTVSQPMFGFTN